MICTNCGNELHNIVEFNQSINQPLNVNAAAGIYNPIWTTVNSEAVINGTNLNGAAPISGTFTIIANPKN